MKLLPLVFAAIFVMSLVTVGSGCSKSDKGSSEETQSLPQPSARPASVPATQRASRSENASQSNAVITGRVVESSGQGVSDALVVLIWLKGDTSDGFPWPLQKTTTDDQGRYQFKVAGSHWYAISVGRGIETSDVGKRSTTIDETGSFKVEPNETVQAKRFVVRRATNSCKVTLRYEDGRPAANLGCGYFSKSFTPVGDDDLRTNDKGEILLSHLLPDEPYTLWVCPKEQTMCLWRRLDPKADHQEFTIRASELISLPPDPLPEQCRIIASYSVFAKDSKVSFRLADVDGNMVSLEDQRFKNKAVVMNICGSWCGSCRLEIPYLVDLQKQYGRDGLEVIGVSFESSSQTKEQQVAAARKLAQDFKLNYPLLVGGSGKADVVESTIKGLKEFAGYPTTLYIDRHGIVKYIRCGFFSEPLANKQWELKQMDDRVRSILGLPAPSATQPASTLGKKE